MNPTTNPQAVIIAVTVLLAVAACSPAQEDNEQQPTAAPTPVEETTAITTDDNGEQEDWDQYVRTPQARGEVLVAEQRAFNGGWRIFEADRWRAEEGCGCALVDGGAELYPAGTEVALYVVEFNPRQMTMNDQARLGAQDWWTLPDLGIDAIYLPSGSAAVLAETGKQALAGVNIDQIPNDDIAWGPQGLTGGQGLRVEPGPGDGGAVWFAAAYWIDPPARELQIILSGIVAEQEMTPEHDETWLSETLTVPLHPQGR